MASSISIGDDPRVYHTYFSMVRGLSLVCLEQLYVYCELAWVVGRSKYLLRSTTNFNLICGKKTTPEVGVDNWFGRWWDGDEAGHFSLDMLMYTNACFISLSIAVIIKVCSVINIMLSATYQTWAAQRACIAFESALNLSMVNYKQFFVSTRTYDEYGHTVLPPGVTKKKVEPLAEKILLWDEMNRDSRPCFLCAELH